MPSGGEVSEFLMRDMHPQSSNDFASVRLDIVQAGHLLPVMGSDLQNLAGDGRCVPGRVAMLKFRLHINQ